MEAKANVMLQVEDHFLPSRRHTILVTGGTGYVGGQLIDRLLPHHTVRCLTRHPEKLPENVRRQARVIAGNVLHTPTLRTALAGVDAAYYLIHGMGEDGDFQKQDRLAAEGFAATAREAEVRRIIYLGGLGDDRDPKLSPHLRSRHEVGQILRSCGVPVLELRASVVLGPGSVSYQLVRELTERLPLLVCPQWLNTPTQPIAIEDVLCYLEEALDVPLEASQIVEIGCREPVTYGDLIRLYAQERNLRRVLVWIPLRSPHLSSWWLGRVAPDSANVGKYLIEGLQNATVVRDNRWQRLFRHQPMTAQEAVRRAVEAEDQKVRV